MRIDSRPAHDPRKDGRHGALALACCAALLAAGAAAQAPNPGFAPAPRSPSAGLVMRQGTHGGVAWAAGSRLVEQSAAATCTRLQPEHMANREGAELRRVRRTAHGWIATHHVHRRVVQFDFSLEWVVEGTGPAGCACRWTLRDGPRFLRQHRGWIRVSRKPNGHALVEVRHDLDAPRTSPSDAARHVQHLVGALIGPEAR